MTFDQDALDTALTMLIRDDEEECTLEELIQLLQAATILAAFGGLWRVEYYTRTKKAYLEVAFEFGPVARRGKKPREVRYRRYTAWLPSSTGTTTSQCTLPVCASKEVPSEGAGADEAPAEGGACAAGVVDDPT